MVPDTQLASDLSTSALPNYGLVVPDQCHDMEAAFGLPCLAHACDAVVPAMTTLFHTN